MGYSGFQWFVCVIESLFMSSEFLESRNRLIYKKKTWSTFLSEMTAESHFMSRYLLDYSGRVIGYVCGSVIELRSSSFCIIYRLLHASVV